MAKMLESDFSEGRHEETLIQHGTKHDADGYYVLLPFRDDKASVSRNRAMARKGLDHMKRRLRSKPYLVGRLRSKRNLVGRLPGLHECYIGT